MKWDVIDKDTLYTNPCIFKSPSIECTGYENETIKTEKKDNITDQININDNYKMSEQDDNEDLQIVM